jgi:MFS family permease
MAELIKGSASARDIDDQQSQDIAIQSGASIASQFTGWGRRYEIYVILVLMVVQTFNFFDRRIINILSEPIKNEFHLSDWQLGLLNGLAFAIFYSTLGIPIARLAEKTNRSYVIAGSIGIWSFATMSTAIVQKFPQLLLSRLVVGVGEAGSTPAAHSLISEVVPRERRATALSIVSAGIPIGGLLGIALGGVMADAMGWRWAFVWAGAPGLILAVVVALTIREPRKHHSHLRSKSDDSHSLKQSLREIFERRTFCYMALGASIVGMNSQAKLAFMPSFYLRNQLEQFNQIAHTLSLLTGHEFSGLAALGMALGLSYGVGGLGGVLAGGWLCDRLARRDVRSYATVPMWACLIVIPLGIGSLVVQSALISIAFMALASFFQYCYTGPIYACVQSIVPSRNRATAAGVMIFMINIFGLAIGAPLIGAISDLFATTMGLGSGWGLGCALIVSQMITLVGILFFFLASRTVSEEVLG